MRRNRLAALRTGASQILRQRSGPLTRELLLTPGRFGLGQVPARLEPDATTTMVCGFCSTGCGLTIHLRDGEAVNLTPATDYPVNLGMACPKGWEALTVLDAADRATVPLLRDARRRRAGRSTGTTALATMVEPVQGDPGRARRRLGRLPQHRPDRHRGDGAARRAGEVRHGDGPRRRQHPPVHGHGRRRLQAGVRVRRPAVHLPGLRRVRLHRPRRLEPLHRAPDHVGAGHAQPEQARDHRRRPAPDRDGDGRHAAPAAPAQVRPVAVLRPGEPPDPATAGSTARSSTRTPRASTTARAFVRRFGLRRGRLRDRARRRGDRRRSPRASTQAKRVSFWWTMGVNQSHEGGPHGAGDHQPGADDRQHRPARHRGELDHRPVQRDGLAALLATPRTCSAATTSPTPTHRDKVAGILEHPRRDASPTETELGLRPDHRGRSATARSRASGSSPPTRRTRGSTRSDSARCSAGSTSWSCRTCTTRPRRRSMADLLLPAAGWGEKEGTFINSERRHRPDQEGPRVRRGRRWPTSTSSSSSPTPTAAATCSASGTIARGGLPDPQASSRAGQPCDITGIDDYRMLDEARRHPVAVPGGRDAPTPRAASAGCSPTGASSTPTAARGSSSRTPRPLPEPTDDALPVHAAHRPRQRLAVAHADAHGEVGRAAQALPARGLTSRSTRPTPRGLGIEPDEVVRWSSRAAARSRRARS